MSFEIILLIVVVIMLGAVIAILQKGFHGSQEEQIREIKTYLLALTQNVKDTEKSLKDEFTINRAETAQNSKDLRQEVSNLLNTFSDRLVKLTASNEERLDKLTSSNEERLDKLRGVIENKLDTFQTAIDANNKDSRKELKENLDSFKIEMNAALKDFKENLRDNFADFRNQQQTQNQANVERMTELKRVLEISIKTMQEGNEKKLEEMRQTVDEKLQKTLEARLTQSFNMVSQSLESVQKGLGEMQQLATGVGDLKKVLSNVKSRGILGEIQLGAILEQILSPDQYQKNVITKEGTRDNVEYAVCLPGRENEGKYCYLPVDSKFPVENYNALLDAYDLGDPQAVEIARKGVEAVIKKCAKDIRDKYISPPDTTDFGIMFLPFEGLYAEVVRNTSLVEVLQRDFNIVITGPSTLAALLSSLRLGFRTLAIEKRSGEIKKTLAAVKTEFGKFGDVLRRAQDKIIGANEEIEKLVSTRTRLIQNKLKSFEEISSSDAQQLIGTGETDLGIADEE